MVYAFQSHLSRGKTKVGHAAVDEGSAKPVMRAARTRWRIENETFKTLKRGGYEFEHKPVFKISI